MAVRPAILLVEDHAALRSSLKSWFASVFPHLDVLEADSAEGAMSVLDHRTPRIVVMDISLPGMDGIHATRLIKARSGESEIVMLSIHDEQAYREAAERAGAAAFVSKARMYTELIPVLTELLEGATKP